MNDMRQDEVDEIVHRGPTPFLDDHLARLKQPKELVILDEFPRNAAGEVVKGALRGCDPSKS